MCCSEEGDETLCHPVWPVWVLSHPLIATWYPHGSPGRAGSHVDV
ncbi:rCG53046 [Rattus norvegicus]|uniref:RCG53046 n=1 Tax=Rattus norvegicus TaxID=10116 RepID=A6KPT5_RAT|nr:rCG53046 [Rattus norvegicus]